MLRHTRKLFAAAHWLGSTAVCYPCQLPPPYTIPTNTVNTCPVPDPSHHPQPPSYNLQSTSSLPTATTLHQPHPHPPPYTLHHPHPPTYTIFTHHPHHATPSFPTVPYTILSREGGRDYFTNLFRSKATDLVHFMETESIHSTHVS